MKRDLMSRSGPDLVAAGSPAAQLLKTSRYGKQSFVIPRTLTRELEELSRNEGVTVFETLLTAFKILLHRYSPCDQFETPVGPSNTHRTEIPIECFDDTPTLLGDPLRKWTFLELLSRLSSRPVEPSENQGAALIRPVPASRLNAGFNNSSRLHVAFARQTESGQDLHVFGFGDTFEEVTGVEDEFDLSLSAWKALAHVKGGLGYRTGVFADDTIRRLLGHFMTLLQGIVKNPTQHISRLPLLTEAEVHQQLFEWNDSQKDLLQARCIHELFETQVERSPNRVAVAFGKNQLTYRELNAQANQLAHRLRDIGVGPETLVGLYLERSLEMIVGVLGTLKAGAAYVPLDPLYPRERLEYMLADAQPAALVTHPRLVPTLPAATAQVICHEPEVEGVNDPGNPATPVSLTNLAYVMYTSGSTGVPKGVMVSHANLLHSTIARWKYYREPVVSFLLLSSFAFDSSVAGIFWTLTQGGSLILPTAARTIETTYLCDLIATYKISHLLAIPSLYAAILQEERAPQLLSLRTVIVAGENCPATLVEDHARRLQCASLYNEYGPTEGTVWSTVYRCKSQEAGGSVPIGRPISNTQVYILDSHMQLLPVGIPGEVYLSGLGVAQGYLNRPELTAQKFITHVFSSGFEVHLYKTGDLARYSQDGEIYFVGRIDQQLKVRGFRVEPGEIEAHLTKHPNVQHAIVLAREDGAGDKKLVVYVVPKPGPRPTASALKAFLESRLPHYMIPAAFIFLDHLPVTVNGKVDRLALPAPGPVRVSCEQRFVAPRNALEARLARIWEKALDVRPIGVRDNFFDLGGYSLLALRVMRETAKAVGKKVPLARLYQAPTIELLSRFLVGEGDHLPVPSLLAHLQPRGSKPPFIWVHGESSGPILPRYLGPNQPVYGVIHQGHDGEPAAYTTVEAIAAHVLADLQRIQSCGPYFIGGFCFGAIVAFEMAQQLQMQGQTVALLVLLDPDNVINPYAVASPPPAPAPPGLAVETKTTRDDVRRRLYNWQQLPAREKLKYVVVRVRQKIANLACYHKTTKAIRTAACKFYLSRGYSLPRSLHSFYVLSVYDEALKRYTPKPYSGMVKLLRIADNSFDPQTWQTLAPCGLEIRQVPGDHTNILKEPYVKIWAEQLRAWLDQTPAC
jgi:aspartate racemase